MALPNSPVTLTAEQIDHLNRLLSAMRHDINGHTTIILATHLIEQGESLTQERLHLEQGRKVNPS